MFKRFLTHAYGYRRKIKKMAGEYPYEDYSDLLNSIQGLIDFYKECIKYWVAQEKKNICICP